MFSTYTFIRICWAYYMSLLDHKIGMIGTVIYIIIIQCICISQSMYLYHVKGCADNIVRTYNRKLLSRNGTTRNSESGDLCCFRVIRKRHAAKQTKHYFNANRHSSPKHTCTPGSRICASPNLICNNSVYPVPGFYKIAHIRPKSVFQRYFMTF